MKNIILLALLGITLTAHAQTVTLDSTILNERVVIDSIDIPWEISWGPDDYIWMTERFGRVSRVEPSTGTQDVILDISSQVYEQSETGLLGMVLHPDFSNSPHVFLAYTYLAGSSIKERIVRYTYNGTSLVSPLTLLDNITGHTTHVGCRLIILPDNTLIASTGDAQQQGLPQNVQSLSGKILRMNLDGSIPSDNPDPNSYVWSWGHRNAQGLWNAPNGVLYSAEHGPTTDDELNILSKGANYGWPNVKGPCDSPPELTFCQDSNVTGPIAHWTPTIAPSDIIWYAHPSIPELNNKLILTVLKSKKIIAFGFNASGDIVESEEDYLTNEFGRLRDICISPDGKIYLATNGSSWSNNSPFSHSIVELHNAAYVPNSINQTDLISQINIFPNPVRQGQRIQFNKSGLQHIRIFDLRGRLLIDSKESNIRIDLISGLYSYQLELDNGMIYTGKLQVL